MAFVEVARIAAVTSRALASLACADRDNVRADLLPAVRHSRTAPEGYVVLMLARDATLTPPDYARTITRPKDLASVWNLTTWDAAPLPHAKDACKRGEKQLLFTGTHAPGARLDLNALLALKPHGYTVVNVCIGGGGSRAITVMLTHRDRARRARRRLNAPKAAARKPTPATFKDALASLPATSR